MNLKLLMGLTIILGMLQVSCKNDKRAGVPKILVFSETAGYHHECIAKGNTAIKTLCNSNNIEVDTTTNPEFFNEEDLSYYAAVLFFNTRGDDSDYK